MKRTISHIIFFSCLLQLHMVFAQTFSDVSVPQGISFNNPVRDTYGNGLSFYDFNNDGWDDLSFALEDDSIAIYLNNNGQFSLAAIHIFNHGETKMILWVDYDNNGILDLFITTKSGTLLLLKNDGNFNFTDVTLNAGLSINSEVNYGASFGDYDKDGFLDLYVCKYLSGGNNANLAELNNLYHNNGNGTFTDVTYTAGLGDSIKPSFQSIWLDYDEDSWPDILVVNDRYGYSNSLYRNNGDGTFSDLASQAGIGANMNNFMTGSIADFDNDEDLDVYMSNTATFAAGVPDFPHLFSNQGNGQFINVAASMDLELGKTTWGGLWLDYNNDGLQDLYVATSFLDTGVSAVSNYLFTNNYPQEFQISNSIFNGNHVAKSHSVARGDIDNNGFYDIVAHNQGAVDPFVWLNSGNTANHVKITLEGTVSNKFAIGSWIKVYADGKVQTQYTLCGENYLGQNSQHHIFGVGNASMIDSITVKYTSGIEDKYYNLPVNQNYQFLEGETVPIFSISNLGNTILCQGDSTVLSAPVFGTYLWNTGETTREISVWEPSTYNLVAIDSNGISHYSDAIIIEVLPAIEILNTTKNVSCADGSDGELYLNINNQGRPYAITWLHGASGDSIFNLTAGTYIFNYSDSMACTMMDSVLIQEPFPLNIQTLVSSETPASLGAISIVINGGVAPYEIFLDDFFVAENMDSLSAGFYFVEVFDDHDCYWSDELEILYEDTTPVQTGLLSNQDLLINVYPIPFDNTITLSFTSKSIEPLEVYLFTEEGKLLLSKYYPIKIGFNQLEIKIKDSVPSGLYFLEMRSDQETSHKILVKY